jgi:DNA-binding transcriptional LysR family regulator
MTLMQMKYAIAVADTKSMNEAARSLFITQPSLSASIKELENEIGVELFKRTNRGITVTPEGEEFLGYARQVVEQYRLIESKYIEKENVRKKFSVSMQHYSFAVQAFVEMVRQFGMDKYEFAVHETKTYEVIEDVKNFKSEIGILYLNDFNSKVLTKLFTGFWIAGSMPICGREIHWHPESLLLWMICSRTHVWRLSRETIIPSILQKKSFLLMNISS